MKPPCMNLKHIGNVTMINVENEQYFSYRTKILMELWHDYYLKGIFVHLSRETPST